MKYKLVILVILATSFFRSSCWDWPVCNQTPFELEFNMDGGVLDLPGTGFFAKSCVTFQNICTYNWLLTGKTPSMTVSWNLNFGFFGRCGGGQVFIKEKYMPY